MPKETELGFPMPPHPEVTSQVIVDLTNQTFDRLQPQLAIYSADSRRSIEKHDGVDLTIGGESRLWESGAYGKLAIQICSQKSLEDTQQLLLNQFSFKDSMDSPFRSHLSFLQEITVGYPERRQRYQPMVRGILLHVLRDRYPRGDTNARSMSMKPDEDYSTYPPDDWGERHKVGVEFVTRFKDILAPERDALWRFGMYHQTRFDKPAPQTEIKSTFDGLVDTQDLSVHGFKSKMSTKTGANYQAVEGTSEVFNQAKDLRPLVSHITKLLRERAAMQAILNDFSGLLQARARH